MTEAKQKELNKVVNESMDKMLKEMEDDFVKKGYEKVFPGMTKESFALSMMGSLLMGTNPYDKN